MSILNFFKQIKKPQTYRKRMWVKAFCPDDGKVYFIRQVLLSIDEDFTDLMSVEEFYAKKATILKHKRKLKKDSKDD